MQGERVPSSKQLVSIQSVVQQLECKVMIIGSRACARAGRRVCVVLCLRSCVAWLQLPTSGQASLVGAGGGMHPVMHAQVPALPHHRAHPLLHSVD